MARPTRSESRERTRAAIVGTARELFLADGLGGVPLERIAEAAGYTRGAVYSNFGDKAELGVAVLESIYAERLRAAGEAVSGAADGAERLARLREWAGAALGDPAVTLLECEVVAALRRQDELRERLATSLRTARSKFATILRSEALTDAVFALVIGVGVQRAVDPSIATTVIDEVLTAVGGGERPANQFLNSVQKPGYPALVHEVERDSKTGSGSTSVNRRGQRSRGTILAAARSAFAVKRYDEVSIAEIATAAGVAAGSIGYHFGGKYELYLAVHEAVFDDFWDRLQQLRGPAMERLISGFGIYLDFAQQEGLSFVMTPRTGVDERLAAQHQGHRDRLISALLTEIVSSGDGSALRIAMDGWLAFVEGATARWLNESERDREQLQSLVLAAGFATIQTTLALDPAITLTSRTIAALLDIDHARRPERNETS
ncbi:TetR/AcrR family transcriptional regulator [Nocardia sp. NBC_01503]|uniref:TetR/AcrR family transcriptional regulator n=1 Tax=Nocardia sp. NBC_01503 TaxID=2975997 RepID=UPI002E7C309D|nr:TetR/AcrR family transcriptional regulator [Nocardia sp. NBC_01503]WTL31044.1 TetR/AcrR family transcriptional regulator [Nocardia sp. NBC_01503]